MEVNIKNFSFYDHAISKISRKDSYPIDRRIDDITLHIKPGTVNVVIGNVHESKNLIDVIGLSYKNGFCTGSLFHDRSIRKSGSYQDIAVVKNYDFEYFSNLTVFDYLYWSATLRTWLSEAECSSRSREISKLVGLDSDVCIHELSSGDILLLSIASEIISSPTLLCIHAPFEALDTQSSFHFACALSRICRRQHTSTTIIFSCTALQSHMIHHVDRVVLFHHSRVLFNEELSAANPSHISPSSFVTKQFETEPNDTGEKVEKIKPKTMTMTLTLQQRNTVVQNTIHQLSNELLSSYSVLPKANDLYVTQMHSLTACCKTSSPTVADDDDESVHHRVEESNSQVEERARLLAKLLHSRITVILSEFEVNMQFYKSHILASSGNSSSMSMVGNNSEFDGGHGHTLAGDSADDERTTQEADYDDGGGPASKAGTADNGQQEQEAIINTAHSNFDSSRSRKVHASRIFRNQHGVLRETCALAGRSWDCIRKNKKMTRLFLVRFIVMGVLVGLVVTKEGSYAQDSSHDTSNSVEDDDSFNTSSTLFLLLVVNILGYAYYIPHISSLIYTLKQEVNYSLYNTLSGYLSLMLVEGLVQVLGGLTLSVIFRLFLEIHDNNMQFYIVVVLSMTCSVSLATAMELYCANKFDGFNNNSPLQSYTGVGEGTSLRPKSIAYHYFVFVSILFLVCGYLQYIEDMIYILQWITQVSFVKWSFEGLMIATFNHTKYGNNYLHSYGFQNESFGKCILGLTIWVGALQALIIYYLFPNARNIFNANEYKNVLNSALRNQNWNSVEENLQSEEQESLNPLSTQEQGDKTSASASASVPATSRLSIGDIERSSNSNSNSSSLQVFTSISPSPSLYISSNHKVHLRFKQLSFSLQTSSLVSSDQSTGISIPSISGVMEEELILSNLSASFAPQTFCCILDDSIGAFRTVNHPKFLDDGFPTQSNILLNTLAGCMSDSAAYVSGEIFVNDTSVIQGRFNAYSALVSQGDELVEEVFTVREVLQFRMLMCEELSNRYRHSDSPAKLSTPSLCNLVYNEQIVERVNLLLTYLDLVSVADTIIGRSNVNGLNPTQRRCFTIALSMTHLPGIVFIQNPFHQLDLYHSSKVANVLQRMAFFGFSIFITYPYAICDKEIYNCFSHILFIQKNVMIYSGKADNVTTHFQNIGYVVPSHEDVLSFLLDICSSKAIMTSVGSKEGKTSKSSLLTFKDLAMLNNTLSITLSQTALDPSSNSLASPASLVNGKKEAFRNCSVIVRLIWFSILKRFSECYRKQNIILRYTFFSILTGCLLGCIWYNIESGNIQARILLFAITYIYIFLLLSDLLKGIHNRHAHLMMQRYNGHISVISFWLSDMAAIISIYFGIILVFVIPFYVLSGLRNDIESFLLFVVLLVVGVYSNLGLLHVISLTCHSAINSRIVYIGVILPLQVIFSGSLFYLSSIPSWIKWGVYLNPMMYFLSCAYVNEFHHNSEALGSDLLYSSVKDTYGFTVGIYDSFILFVLIGFVYHILWLFLLYYNLWLNTKHKWKKGHTYVIKNAERNVRKFMKANLRLRKREAPFVGVSDSNGNTTSMEMDSSESRDYNELGADTLHGAMLSHMKYRRELPQTIRNTSGNTPTWNRIVKSANSVSGSRSQSSTSDRESGVSTSSNLSSSLVAGMHSSAFTILDQEDEEDEDIHVADYSL